MSTAEPDRSIDRAWKAEEFRAKSTGWGTTKQGQAVARLYQPQLADLIADDRGHDKTVWRALNAVSVGGIRRNADDLAQWLLAAGISVCCSSDLGVDRTGVKTLRDIALWIGQNLCNSRDVEVHYKVGVWGINKLIRLPVFVFDPAHVDVLTMTAEADEVMNDVLARTVVNNPLLSPLTQPPVPWTQVRKGGLPPDHWANVSLVGDRQSIENAARKAISIGKMQPALDAINYLQSTPFTINKPVLAFLQKVNEAPVVNPKLPKHKRGEALAKLKTWSMGMVTADAVSGVDRFWIPSAIDFRGRLNPIPYFNFTKDDSIRGLFLFAAGEPIGEDGLRWLKAHVASKASGAKWSGRLSDLDLGARIAWTNDNLPLLCQIGQAVLNGNAPESVAWALPKDKYQFLAACAELVQALDKGPGFITRLPLTFDATCSGLQHLCGMTRAPEGVYVNLTPSDEGDDFYRRVAFEVWLNRPALRRFFKGSDATVREKGTVLVGLGNPFDRELIKKLAMSYFYGSRPGGWVKDKGRPLRPVGMTEQIVEVLEKRGQSIKGAKDLADAVYQVIEGMAPMARAVRDWLEKLARICAKHNKPVRWTTPLGLPVRNEYHPGKIVTISTKINGVRRRTNLTVGDLPGIKTNEAVQAITANFTHAADAAHLQFVALAAAKEGIPMVSVHDCFGTIAPHARRLNELIREQFVHLHEQHDLLADVLASVQSDLPKHVKLPPLPQRGFAKIADVLKSFHAFK
jgi:DNA-directed RNA polymerase, mitochondrial